MLFSLYANGNGARNTAIAYMYGASMWLDDADNPAIGAPQLAYQLPGQGCCTAGVPSGWVNGGLFGASADIVDAGLGVNRLTLQVDGQNKQTRTYPCTGGKDNRCPSYWPSSQNNIQYSAAELSEGVHRLNLVGTDIIDHTSSPSASWQLRVDTIGPSISLNGRLSDLIEKEIYADRYTMTVDATDGATTNDLTRRSGTRSLSATITDAEGVRRDLGSVDRSCATDSCSSSLPVSIDASVLAPGAANLVIKAVDEAGNTNRRTLRFFKTDLETNPTEAKVAEYNLGQRREFELNTSPSLIDSVIHDPRQDYTRTQFSFSTTDAEYEELLMRNERQDQLPEVERYAEEHPSGYAGMWVDQSDHGRIRVQYTQNANERENELRQTLSRPDGVLVETVGRTRTTLLALVDQIREAESSLDASGIHVQGLGIDDPTNTVRVSLASNTAAVRNALLDRFGTGLLTFQSFEDLQLNGVEPIPGRAGQFDPLEAGVFIATTRGGCTSGFAVRDVESESGQFVNAIITAGHCVPGNRNDESSLVTQGGEVIGGKLHGSKSKSADAATVKIASRGIAAIVRSARSQLHVVDVATDRNDAKKFRYDKTGQRICMSGAYSGESCGKLLGNIDKPLLGGADSPATTNLRYTSGTMCRGGDSGAPVYATRPVRVPRLPNVVAVGIHAGSGLEAATKKRRCFYSHIGHVLQGFYLDPKQSVTVPYRGK